MVTLSDLRTKVRRITGRYDSAQLTNKQINIYINLFYTLQFPEEFKTYKLTSPYIFNTVPNVDCYQFPYQNGLPGGQSGNISIFPPVFCQGYQLCYYQDKSIFYNRWPKLTNAFQINSGNNTVGPYFGTIPFTPMLRANMNIFGNVVQPGVLLTANSSGFTMTLTDQPTDDLQASPPVVSNIGNLVGPQLNPSANNFINYITGQYSFTTNVPIPSGTPIQFQGVPFEPSRPIDVLMYNNLIIFRPVPADSYQIEFQVSRQPTDLMADSDSPEMNEWYLFIALGTAKLIYTDFPDPEGEATCERQFEEQRLIAQRRTLKQISSSQRAPTIFSTPTRGGVGYPGWSLPGNN